MPDFNLINNLNFHMLKPNNEQANAWIEENLPAEINRLGSMIYVETRFIEDVVAGISSSGLTIN